jgi:precorrin-3B synthase
VLPATDVGRSDADRCPGALTLFPAADGGLARVRVPGGFADAAQLRAIAQAAREIGNGGVELTSRGNVQVRGVPDGAIAELGDLLAAAGLLPSMTHERVRNVVASPLAGIDNDRDLSSLVAELDAALCSEPALAELPGRFLFAIDDGRGDVAALGADVTATLSESASVEGIAVDSPVAAMIAVAAAFLLERVARGSQAWRVDELGRLDVLERAGFGRPRPRAAVLPPSHPAGLVAQPDGGAALVVLAPLGRLQPHQLDGMADVLGGRPARITPWRSVVLPDIADPDGTRRAMVDAGLGVDVTSRWFGVSACTGSPGCAKSLADVQADAAASAGQWPGRVVHWSGCERRCGRPRDTAVDVVARVGGYDVHE